MDPTTLMAFLVGGAAAGFGALAGARAIPDAIGAARMLAATESTEADDDEQPPAAASSRSRPQQGRKFMASSVNRIQSDV